MYSFIWVRGVAEDWLEDQGSHLELCNLLGMIGAGDREETLLRDLV